MLFSTIGATEVESPNPDNITRHVCEVYAGSRHHWVLIGWLARGIDSQNIDRSYQRSRSYVLLIFYTAVFFLCKYLAMSYGEGNGTPLQSSCLANSMDRGAWWAAVYGVAQSWTWLKWLSSSSSIHLITANKITQNTMFPYNKKRCAQLCGIRAKTVNCKEQINSTKERS